MINGAEGGVREPIPVLEIDSCHVVMLWQLWQCQQAGALQKRRIRGKAQELLAPVFTKDRLLMLHSMLRFTENVCNEYDMSLM